MTEQKPMSTTNQPGLAPGQQQTQPGQQQAMPTPNVDPAAAQKRAEEGQRAFEDAERQMTNRLLYDRIRAAHPHANQSTEAVKTMLDDYRRLEAEQQKAGGQPGHQGDPGHQGQGQATAPGQNPAQPKT